MLCENDVALASPIATKKMYQPASYLIRFSSSGHCWKHLLLRDTLVFNIRHEKTEWQMFNVHQRWHCALGQEPLSQHFGQLWTPAVPCFIFKTETFSFSSKQALSNNVFGVKIGRTTTLRRLFKVINFRRSKFVCTLWTCLVFGMRAAGLATHLTTPVCPVARTQTKILQVVYFCKKYLYYCIHSCLATPRRTERKEKKTPMQFLCWGWLYSCSTAKIIINVLRPWLPFSFF